MAKTEKRIRYAVVGMGHIAQVAVLPAFAHAGRNSMLTAIVSGDSTKRREISRKYSLSEAYSYAEYEDCLRRVDAVYIALPNSMHEEYTIRAAKAGVHVLCEKPMAVTVDQCRRMIGACRRNGVKLMVGYRLHFERVNLEVIDLVRKGRIGEPRFFNSSFSMTVRQGNVRTKARMGGGTLYDIGVYCVNAARYLFRSEPVEVQALSVNSGVRKLAEIDESTGALLRFEGNRLAAFITSFNASDAASYLIVGSKGRIQVDPAYEYAEGLQYELVVDGKKTRKAIGKRDQFAPELLYFSDCILEDRSPEPSGEEGLQDVRVVEALYRSAQTRKAVKLPQFRDSQKPTLRQKIERPGIRKPRLIKVASAGDD
ncbi:MAG TPA: Gfo/Idh/MocA family oxidoreductase [Terriglobia bacterium]|nr:Gfo/Idh/MocA family oxidoreductase [Terriglobia bacterium]